MDVVLFSLPKSAKIPKDQIKVIFYIQNVPNFAQLFLFFCTTSATNLAQLLDFLSATFCVD